MPEGKSAGTPGNPGVKHPHVDPDSFLAAVIRDLPANVIVADASSGALLLVSERAGRSLQHPRVRSTRAGEYGDYQGFHTDGRPYSRDEWPIVRSMHTGETVQSEQIPYRHVDGSRGVMRVSSCPVRDDAGRIIAAIGVIDDITEFKRVESQLLGAEQRLESIFNALDESIVITDAVTRAIVDCNPAIERNSGYSRDEIIGRTPEFFYASPEDYRRFAAAFTAALENNGVYVGEWSFRHKDGRLVPCEQTITQVTGSDGKPTLRIAVVRDVSERVHAQESLRRSEERFRSLVETTSDWIWEVDAQGVYTYASPGVKNLLGYAPSEVLGRTPFDMMPPEEAERLRPVVRRHFETAKPLVALENVNLHKNGRLVLLETNGVPVFDERGDLSGYRGVDRDITRRKRAEEALLHARDELERRVQERTAELAHRSLQLRTLALELTQAESRERTRLAGVLHDHLQQLLVGAKFGAQLARQQTRSTRLKDSIQNVTELLDECIKASRSLTAELAPPILHDAGLVAAIEWLGRWMSEKYGLTVDVTAETEVEPDAEGVCILLFQSVRELLFNVIKHSGARHAHVSIAAPEAGRIQIIVADEGVGFDSARAHADGSDAGFGLFSIRERIDLLGGCIAVDSAPGAGARVTLIAPLLKRAAPRRAAAPSPLPAGAVGVPAAATAGGRIRVLVVDDHAILRQGLIQLLDREPDIEVVGEAPDGQAALEMAHRLCPDVVVMDVSMPRMGGVEATARIACELPCVRVIGLSMYERADRAAAMRDAGAVAYLTKDGPSEDLVAAIRATQSDSPQGS